MGVLDEIGAELAGGTAKPAETLMETPLPRGGSLDRIAEDLQKQKDLEAYSAGPEKLMMPDLHAPAPVNDITRRPQDFVGPQKPIKPVPAPEPALGWVGQAVGDTLAKTLDDVKASFTEKGNPILAGMAQQYREQGVAGVLNGVREAAVALPVGFGSFIAGAASSVGFTLKNLYDGDMPLDAIHKGWQAGQKLGEGISSLAPTSPISQGIVTAAAAPFAAVGQLLDKATDQFTDDPRIHSTVQFAYALALMGAGEKAIDWLHDLAKGKVEFDPRVLATMAEEGTADPQVHAAAEVAANELAPLVKTERAMISIVSHMDDEQLIREHANARWESAQKDHPATVDQWRGTLGREIAKRDLIPLDMIDLDRPQAMAEAMGKGVTSSAAEGGPGMGVDMAKFKPKSENEMFGLTPMYEDPKWYWYLKEKGLVPKDVPPPAGAEKYRPDFWTRPDHPAQSNTSTMMVDRPYTEYPQGGEGEPRQVNKLVPAIDVNDVRLNMLNEGNTPGYEPDPTLKTKRPYRDEKSGRWFVPAPLGHPGADQNGMIPWSRLVFENKRGGYLRPDEEVVHHGPDFNPGNNAPENLHAFSDNEAHMKYHNSEQGIRDRINQAEIRAQQESDAEVNHPKDYIIYVENTKTGEFLPAQPNHQTGPYDIIIQQYKSGKHNVIDYGKSVPPELVERAGGPPAGPEAGGATAMPAAELDRITGDISQLVNEAPGGPHQYGWSYHPMKGDSQLGWANGQHVLSKWPDRGDIYKGAKPTDEQISQFVLKNSDLLEDPRNFVGGYTADNGDFHLDISTTEADRAKAEAYGKQYDQKAVGFLHPTEGYQDIPTGGTGRRWTPEEAQAAGWAHPTKRNDLLPAPQEGQGGAPVTEPGPGPAPAGQPPVTPENPATPDDLTGASSLYKPGEGFLSGMKTPGLSIVKPEDAARTTAALRNLRTALIDKYYPIHRLVKAIKKEGVQIQDAHNPSLLISTLGGVSGKAQAKIAYKTFHVDADGFIQFDGKGLTEILKPHAEELDAFDNYMIAARALEIERANKSRLIEDKIDTGIDLPWAKKTYAEGHEKFSPAHKEYVGYFHSMLDELANVGLLKKEVVKKWKEDSPEYAPLKRDMESIADSLDKGAGPNGRSRQMLNKVMNPIMRMKGGGELPVLPPSQSAVMMTYEITNAIERARAARSVIELRNMSPDLAKLITPATGPGKDVVVVPENGEMAYWHVPQDISDAMKLIHETGLSSLVRAFAMPSRLLRAGATLSPEFVLRVPGRRMLTAFVNAEHGFNPLTDFPRGLYDVIKKPEEYWKWKASGGDQSMINSMSKTFASDELKAMSDEKQTAMIEAAKPFIGLLASTGKVAATLLHPLGAMESLSNYGEKPTRLGVYGRASRAGESDLASAAESRRASTDFSVKGGANGVKQVAAGYAFLNARVQTTRTIFDTAIEHPGRTALRGIAAATIPSIVLYAINRNDPEYWKRDQAERDLMWFLPIKIGGRQVRYPKGLVGVTFGTSIEKVMEAMDSKAETRSALTEWLNEMLKNILPVSNIGEAIPVALRPVAEAALNRNFFYGNAIESDTDKGVAPYLRFGPRTSETMKLIGEKLGAFNKGEGVSPKMMEEVVHGYTGGVGRHALEASDWALGKLGVTKTGEKAKDPANTPGLAGFMSRRAVGFESQPAKDFYDMMPEVKKTKATLDTLYDMAAAAGNNEEVTNKVKEMMIWLDNHRTETALLRDLMPQLVKAEADLSLLKKQQNEVVQDKTYTSDKKRAMLDEIDQQVSTIVDPLSKLILHYKKSPPAASK